MIQNHGINGCACFTPTLTVTPHFTWQVVYNIQFILPQSHQNLQSHHQRLPVNIPNN